MLQNNELMKKINFTDEASVLFVKDQRERSKSKGPKGIQRLLAVSLTTFARN